VRNQEAARYAGWAGIAAGSIALLVLGIYAERAIRASRRHHETPASVPASVQQQTQTFIYNGGKKDRTLFTIRASRATQFREGDQALLEDVWISIYGPQGDRNDNIHTRECSYNQKTGSVQCKGELTIDIQGTSPGASSSSNSSSNSSSGSSSGAPVEKSMQIKTSNLTFDGQSGEASTPAGVDFTLPQGHGHGVGVVYSTQTSIVRVEHAVEFEATPSERTTGLPVSMKGSSLEIRRNDRTVVLAGPATVRQGDRELSADRISIDLDENFHARHVLAEGRPLVHGSSGGATFAVSAASFEGFLNPDGWVERIVADGGVTGTSKSATGSDNFSGGRVDVALEAKRNVLREIMATGGVTAGSEQNGISQRLRTKALRVKFASADQPDHQHIESAETLAPGTIESKSGDASTELRAPKFNTRFTADGHLARLVGSGGVEVRNQTGSSPAQVSTAQNLNATFARDGQWSTVDEAGDVHFTQADRQATAAHANIDRGSDQIVLSGSPVVSDAMSRTSAREITIGQKSGQIEARDGVVSTYLPSGEADSVNLGSGPAHITAETLSGSTASGRVVYSGHARLWQGESVLDADEVTLWRDEKKMQAKGNVVAVFPQTSGPTLKAVSQSSINGKPSAVATGPGLWHVRAPSLTYWNEQNKAQLEGGVTAISEQGSIVSRLLDVYLGSTAAGARSGQDSKGGGGQMSRAVAQGDVKVTQGDWHGTAEQAEYTSADQKFVLSGGQPALIDSSGNITTGRSLTFFVASDTILIDSQAGSRTLTKHRVEK
jgi:lipopolysaccharide export system protein LptA/lipopolysaccharide export system protein LptC